MLSSALPKYPALGARITDYAQGTDPVRQPGPALPAPGTHHPRAAPRRRPRATREQRPAGAHNARTSAVPRARRRSSRRRRTCAPCLMQKEMRWRDLLAYFRTWSPLLTYHEKHPEDLQRADDPRFLAEDLARAAGDTGTLRRFCGVER